MATLRPVVGYKLSPRIPLEVDLFRQVNPSGRIPTDIVDPYSVEPAIVEPLSEDLYDDYANPGNGGDDRYLEAISRRPLGEGSLWDAHTADQYQPNDLTHDEPGGTEPQNEPAPDTENITSARGKGTIMAGETTITVIGNLTSDPELRFTPSGSAVANFTIASTPRTFDRQSNEWKDGETLFLRASVWREAAENVAESLTKGMRVIVTGRLKSRSYETKEGEKRTVIELEVDEIGPSLRYANAKVNRTQRSTQGGRGNDYQGSANSRPQSGPQDDPWAVPANSNAAGGWGNGPDSEPPF
ncbi:single stranded DNA-binding protein (plasmid) [Pseudarthrobacter phenanthrenivorans Sphe3]|uniref:Single-stranded DNA-binding protein n=1 Tax=Pseudarthrobacter phenanthrenivorans (strain DSM 18606 / JCM 16027 / LMG 23796 / Sphe3) TaxID=930171 RepID=F0MCJ1_PSEPM|nr:single-stranded DNA-binding protein [Pseudarthrobacter phenanthrenivorans]ADX75242.1 single stranded DNA-binding protein [Pseudarthrobacter phenanthrenivorans Sphe3]